MNGPERLLKEESRMGYYGSQYAIERNNYNRLFPLKHDKYYNFLDEKVRKYTENKNSLSSLYRAHKDALEFYTKIFTVPEEFRESRDELWNCFELKKHPTKVNKPHVKVNIDYKGCLYFLPGRMFFRT